MLSAFQFIPKLFSGDEVRACEFFQFNLGKLCLYGPHFDTQGIVVLEYV